MLDCLSLWADLENFVRGLCVCVGGGGGGGGDAHDNNF